MRKNDVGVVDGVAAFQCCARSPPWPPSSSLSRPLKQHDMIADVCVSEDYEPKQKTHRPRDRRSPPGAARRQTGRRRRRGAWR